MKDQIEFNPASVMYKQHKLRNATLILWDWQILITMDSY